MQTCFKTSKNVTGLDEHQVRRWDSWHRHTTLAMLAHAILTVIAARERTRRPPDERGLIPLTFNEIHRLLAKMIATTQAHDHAFVGMVPLAPTPPSTRQDQPLPAPRPSRTSTHVYIKPRAGLLGQPVC